MGRGARGAESQRSSLERFAHPRRHCGYIAGGRFLVVDTALTHHIGAHRTVRDLGTDVDGAPDLPDGIEVFGKRLPLPFDRGGECRSRYVFDRFHHADQKFFVAACHRSESDPAIAHHHRGHTVPARWTEIRVPKGLAVVMGMDVDPSGSYQQTGGVDFAPRRPGFTAYGDDLAGIDRDVAGVSRFATAVDYPAASDH